MPETELGNAQLDAVAQVPEEAGVEEADPPPPPPPHATRTTENAIEIPANLRNLIFMGSLASRKVLITVISINSIRIL